MSWAAQKAGSSRVSGKTRQDWSWCWGAGAWVASVSRLGKDLTPQRGCGSLPGHQVTHILRADDPDHRFLPASVATYAASGAGGGATGQVRRAAPLGQNAVQDRKSVV